MEYQKPSSACETCTALQDAAERARGRHERVVRDLIALRPEDREALWQQLELARKQLEEAKAELEEHVDAHVALVLKSQDGGIQPLASRRGGVPGCII